MKLRRKCLSPCLRYENYPFMMVIHQSTFFSFIHSWMRSAIKQTMIHKTSYFAKSHRAKLYRSQINPNPMTSSSRYIRFLTSWNYYATDAYIVTFLLPAKHKCRWHRTFVVVVLFWYWVGGGVLFVPCSLPYSYFLEPLFQTVCWPKISWF